jgi:hypothetical protein
MIKKFLTFVVFLLIATLLLILSVCTFTNSLDNYERTGTVKIMLEGPANYDPRMLAVNITITDIEATSDGVEWYVISNVDSSIDLLQLNNGVTSVLGITNFEQAVSSEVRLVLSSEPADNYVLVDNDDDPEQYHLDAPLGPGTGLGINQGFEVKGGSTTTVLITFDEADYTFDPDSDTYQLEPIITVSRIDIQEGKIVFYEHFGYDTGSDTIEGWNEDEHPNATFKCSVLEGSDIGGRHARIYGENFLGVNHSFFKEWDLSGYTSGRIVFQAKRSNNWNVGLYDRVFFELFYDGSWHIPYTFYAWNIFENYSELEIPLTGEMMDTQFYARFRNSLPNWFQYLDIDNFELYGIK